jgi:hypothetical protein
MGYAAIDLQMTVVSLVVKHQAQRTLGIFHTSRRWVHTAASLPRSKRPPLAMAKVYRPTHRSNSAPAEQAGRLGRLRSVWLADPAGHYVKRSRRSNGPAGRRPADFGQPIFQVGQRSEWTKRSKTGQGLTSSMKKYAAPRFLSLAVRVRAHKEDECD